MEGSGPGGNANANANANGGNTNAATGAHNDVDELLVSKCVAVLDYFEGDSHVDADESNDDDEEDFDTYSNLHSHSQSRLRSERTAGLDSILTSNHGIGDCNSNGIAKNPSDSLLQLALSSSANVRRIMVAVESRRAAAREKRSADAPQVLDARTIVHACMQTDRQTVLCETAILTIFRPKFMKNKKRGTMLLLFLWLFSCQYNTLCLHLSFPNASASVSQH